MRGALDRGAVCVGVATLVVLGGAARGQTPGAAPPPSAGAPATVAAPAPADAAAPEAGVAAPIEAQAAVVAGNVAGARPRALAEAFRRALEARFALLLGEAGVAEPLPPSLTALRARFVAGPQRLVRGYRVMSESADAATLRLTVAVDVDEALLRAEIARARGGGSPPASARTLLTVVRGDPEAATPIVEALRGAGLPIRYGVADPGDAALPGEAARGGADALAVEARAETGTEVRGTGQRAVACRLLARLPRAGGAAAEVGPQVAHGFGLDDRAARDACFRTAAVELGAGVAATRAPARTRELVVALESAEPAALVAALAAARRASGPAGARPLAIAPGRLEIALPTELDAAAVMPALRRELGAKYALEVRETVGGRVRAAVASASVEPAAP